MKKYTAFEKFRMIDSILKEDLTTTQVKVLQKYSFEKVEQINDPDDGLI